MQSNIPVNVIKTSTIAKIIEYEFLILVSIGASYTWDASASGAIFRPEKKSNVILE